MPPPASCIVCQHPDRGLIEAALRAGVPGVRATARQFQLADHNVLSRHSKKHMDGVALKPAEVARAKIAAAAPEQLERATTALVRARAEKAVEEALAVQAAARLLAERAIGTEEEPGDIEIAAKALKVWIDSNGGGVQKALELLGKLTGELATGNQTNIQVNIEQERARATEAVKSLGEKDVPQLVGEALGLFLDAKGLDETSDVFAVLVELSAHTAEHLSGPGGLRDRFDKALTVGADGRVEGGT